MSQKVVTVTGISNNSQFVVTAQNLEVRISKNENHPELEGPSPLEYVLAGYAGCIHAVGKLVAREQGINLLGLEVEITGTLSLDKYLGKSSDERAGFKSIQVLVRPQSDVGLDVLKYWLESVENRCPIQDNLCNPTPITLTLTTKTATSHAA